MNMTMFMTLNWLAEAMLYHARLLIYNKLHLFRIYHSDLHFFIACRRHMCRNENEADIIFSTAHKAKGLEFDTVKIAGFLDQDLDFTRLSEDEKNILYVAVSRYGLYFFVWLFFCLIVSLLLFPILILFFIFPLPFMNSRNLHWSQGKEVSDHERFFGPPSASVGRVFRLFAS